MNKTKTDGNILQDALLRTGGSPGLAGKTGIPPWALQEVLDGRRNLDRAEISALIQTGLAELRDFDCGPSQGFYHRFHVIEHCDGYSLLDTVTEETHWLSDGVDVITLEHPEFDQCWTLLSGSPELHRLWQREFNANTEETLLAYFPDRHREEYHS